MSLTKRSPNELNAGIDNKKDPKTAVNIFELLLLLIVKDFKLSAKEGAALLDN